MNRSIRNYIRSIITENRMSIPYVDAYPDEPAFYNADEVWESAMDLMESVDADVPADQDLHFFTLDTDGEVSGAAFIRLTETRFSFTVIAEGSSSHSKKDLIGECLEEYDILKGEHPDLILEIADNGMVNLLRESYGFSVLSGSSKLLIE